MMSEKDFNFGDEVSIPMSSTDRVRGTVHEVYGPPGGLHVVVMLTPELSGLTVDEPTTVSMPIELVEKIASAA